MIFIRISSMFNFRQICQSQWSIAHQCVRRRIPSRVSSFFFTKMRFWTFFVPFFKTPINTLEALAHKLSNKHKEFAVPDHCHAVRIIICRNRPNFGKICTLLPSSEHGTLITLIFLPNFWCVHSMDHNEQSNRSVKFILILPIFWDVAFRLKRGIKYGDLVFDPI